MSHLWITPPASVPITPHILDTSHVAHPLRLIPQLLLDTYIPLKTFIFLQIFCITHLPKISRLPPVIQAPCVKKLRTATTNIALPYSHPNHGLIHCPAKRQFHLVLCPSENLYPIISQVITCNLCRHTRVGFRSPSCRPCAWSLPSE